MRTLALTSMAVAGLLWAGCLPVSQLKTRAAFDLDCQKAELQVVDLGGMTRGVTGCGRKATYIWACSPGGPCNWVMNSPSK